MRLALVILALIAAAIGAVLAFAAARWNGVTAETVRQLRRASGARPYAGDLSLQLEGLPPSGGDAGGAVGRWRASHTFNT